MKAAAQDIRDAFARRNVDDLDRALEMLERADQIREAEVRRLREQTEAQRPINAGGWLR